MSQYKKSLNRQPCLTRVVSRCLRWLGVGDFLYTFADNLLLLWYTYAILFFLLLYIMIWKIRFAKVRASFWWCHNLNKRYYQYSILHTKKLKHMQLIKDSVACLIYLWCNVLVLTNLNHQISFCVQYIKKTNLNIFVWRRSQ